MASFVKAPKAPAPEPISSVDLSPASLEMAAPPVAAVKRRRHGATAWAFLLGVAWRLWRCCHVATWWTAGLVGAWVIWDRAGLSFGMAGFLPWEPAHWEILRQRFLYGPALPGPSVVVFILLAAIGVVLCLALLFQGVVRGLLKKSWIRPTWPWPLIVLGWLWAFLRYLGRQAVRGWKRVRAEKPPAPVGSEQWARMRREVRLAKRKDRPALPAAVTA